MAKGKITEYDVGSFSPAAVGVPGEDRSGQIIASGVVNVGKALAARAETSDKLSAMDKFGDFDFKYQQGKMALQTKYQNNPEAYPAAVRDMATKLMEDSSKGMSGGVYQNYKTLAEDAIAQDTKSNLVWAFSRKNEIDGEAFKSANQNIALSASLAQTPQDLESIFKNFDKTGTTALPNLKAEFVTDTQAKYRKLAVENMFNAQLLAQPMEFKAALEGGAYTELLRKNGFGTEMILEYKNKALNALINRSIADQYRTLWSSQDMGLKFIRGLDNGSMNIMDVLSERAAVNANRMKVDPVTGKPVVPEGYVRLLDSIIADKTNAIARTPLGKEEKEKALKDFDVLWNEYLTTKETQRKEAGPEDLAKQLELMKGLIDAKNKGVIDSNDFDAKIAIMNTKHDIDKDTIFGSRPFNESVDQAGMVKVWGQNRPGDDVVSIGYNMIKDHVDKSYPELPESERRDMKAQLLAQYHSEIKALPEGTLKQPKPKNFFVSLARRMLNGGKDAEGKEVTSGILETNSMWKNPTTGEYNRPGDIVYKSQVPTIFKGRDPVSGKPKFSLPPGIEGTNRVINGHLYRINGIDSDGDIDATRIENG